MFLEAQTIEDFGKGDQPEPKTSDLIDMDPSPSSSVDDENGGDVQPPVEDVEDAAKPNEVEPEIEEEHPTQVPSPQLELRKSTRDRQPSRKYPPNEFVLISDQGEPESYQEAIEHAKKGDWKKAMEEEMNSLLENHTYDLVKLPKVRKILKNKCVFKLMNDGKNLMYKARLVVKGFGQKKASDFDEIFSPVVKMSSIWVVLGLVTSMNLEVERLDVKTTFLLW